MRNALSFGRAFVLVIAAAASRGTAASAETNSGLDLTRPLTSIGYTYASTESSGNVYTNGGGTTLSVAMARAQFKLTLPFQGDVGIQYNYIVQQGRRGLRQTIGALASFPSGRTYSADEQQLGVVYQLAYDYSASTSLLFLTKYTVGTNPSALTLRYNELTVSPYILTTTRTGAYAAVIPEYHAYSGERNDRTYDAKVDVGRVLAGHYNLAAFYGLPLGTYSFANLYRSTFGVSFAVQL